MGIGVNPTFWRYSASAYCWLKCRQIHGGRCGAGRIHQFFCQQATKLALSQLNRTVPTTAVGLTMQERHQQHIEPPNAGIKIRRYHRFYASIAVGFDMPPITRGNLACAKKAANRFLSAVFRQLCLPLSE
jgi:hypothetical protein